VTVPAFAAAHGFATDWHAAARTALSSLTVPPGANLGFVYFSDTYVADAEALIAHLRQATGVEHWAGSAGIGICSTGTGAIDRPGISLLVGRFPPESFRVFSGRAPLPHGSDQPYFAVVHADPHTPDTSDLIADMAGKVTSGFITGGLSSGRDATRQIANGVLAGGISGVAFSESIPVATRLTQGCSPLPGTHRIDDCEDNVIARIDGRPALEAYRDAIGALTGDQSASDLRRAAQMILVGLPVTGRGAHDYRARHVIGIDPRSGALAINDTVSPGQSLLFCRRGGSAARLDMRRMLGEIQASLSAPPKAGLYFSCLGRGGSMFENDSTELEMIREHFGALPLTGFYCSGEISHDQLYGYTGVLTLFI
jgi:small ligand-binding sensory domain FIST